MARHWGWTARRLASSIWRYNVTTRRPVGVRAAPPRWLPPRSVTTSGD